MADEDKEKAEKLAAAKKRFEQLKKQQNKKAKKGVKEKEDKATEIKADVNNDDEETPATSADQALDEAAQADGGEDGTEDGETTTAKARSDSSKGADPRAEVQELYRKQAAKIEELEQEKKTLKEQQEEGTSKLAKAEEELESLREGSSDIAELRNRAKETDRLTTELASVQRQLAQAQQTSKSSAAQRQSTATPEFSRELASNTSTIESLELDISNLRNQISTFEATLSEKDASTQELEERATAAETATTSAKQELDALRVSIAFPSDETKAANEDPEALTKRISVLESDLRSANNNLEAAAQRATSLEQKIEALTKLHKQATTASQAKDKELIDLRSQLKRHDRPSHVRDASEFELGEEETETGQLHTRIRALEAENFDLRRGVWRDKRAELQPGMNEEGSSQPQGYEEVDLNGPYSPGGGAARGGLPRQTSTFQDVITSGISAFTGRLREPPSGQTSRPAAASVARERAESMGLMDDDDGFDEDAFAQAQEEEAKRRVERIKEVKRGLDQWKGWRVDLAESRRAGFGQGRDVGPVFEL